MAEPDAPIIGGGPDYIESVLAAQIIPPGYPPPAPPPSRVYVSTQGDWWDLISLKVYGMRRNDDHLMHKLIEANYPLRDIANFPAGIGVVVPEIETKMDIPLVPWKKASRIPT
jgi:phage tail protein X